MSIRDQKVYQHEDFLVEQYATLQKSSKDIANELHISYKLVEIWLRHYNIAIRTTL